MTGFRLAFAARNVLITSAPEEKAELTHEFAREWRENRKAGIGNGGDPPDRPARPNRPELKAPREMKRRGKAASLRGRIALLHAIAHIELNAIDLACDILCRFTDDSLPRAFYDDWVSVADEEARHYGLLAQRLNDLGVAYGDLPAHDGLWEAAQQTSHDLLARLAIVPLVLEARGLDVTPHMIEKLQRAGDQESVDVLRIIYDDEVRHVAAGQKWFDYVCTIRKVDPTSTYHDLVKRHFKAGLKPPFNDEARGRAGMARDFYAPLAP